MLRIRKEQIRAFERHFMSRFIAQMIEHIRSEFPEKADSRTEDELVDLIRDGVNNAAAYDIAAESDIEEFIDCMIRYGIDFDTSGDTEWAGKILNDPAILGFEKMDRISDYETFELEE